MSALLARLMLTFMAVCITTIIGTLPSGAAAAEYDMNASIVRVLELTNMERQRAGLAPLTLSSELTAAAQNYSQVLAETGCFRHDCGTVPNFTDRISLAGYTNMSAAGENIAAGYPTPESVVEGWMNSAGHRANLLSPNYVEIGIGVASGSNTYGIFWTQDFGSRFVVSKNLPAAGEWDLWDPEIRP